MAVSYRIRPARAADAGVLAAMESAAAQRFGDIGLTAIAQGRPPERAEYERQIAEELAWVAETASGEREIVGLALADVVDGQGFLAELSVHPDHGRRGLGRRLTQAVEAWAGASGFRTLSLTTFDSVPWNRPYYECLGFSVLDDEDVGPGLRRLREGERARGLDDLSPRVCMRKSLLES